MEAGAAVWVEGGIRQREQLEAVWAWAAAMQRDGYQVIGSSRSRPAAVFLTVFQETQPEFPDLTSFSQRLAKAEQTRVWTFEGAAGSADALEVRAWGRDGKLRWKSKSPWGEALPKCRAMARRFGLKASTLEELEDAGISSENLPYCEFVADLLHPKPKLVRFFSTGRPLFEEVGRGWRPFSLVGPPPKPPRGGSAEVKAALEGILQELVPKSPYAVLLTNVREVDGWAEATLRANDEEHLQADLERAAAKDPIFRPPLGDVFLRWHVAGWPIARAVRVRLPARASATKEFEAALKAVFPKKAPSIGVFEGEEDLTSHQIAEATGREGLKGLAAIEHAIAGRTTAERTEVWWRLFREAILERKDPRFTQRLSFSWNEMEEHLIASAKLPKEELLRYIEEHGGPAFTERCERVARVLRQSRVRFLPGDVKRMQRAFARSRQVWRKLVIAKLLHRMDRKRFDEPETDVYGEEWRGDPQQYMP